MLSLMDGYARYNQIHLAEEAQEKTSFIPEDGLYYFVVIYPLV